ncbi:MAG: hypothetical protein ACOYX1_03880 [Acidobacteriota bacterium]
MKRSNLTLVLSLLIVFSSGVVVGVVGDRYFGGAQKAAHKAPRTPEDYRRAYVEEMNKRLRLSPDQLRQLNQILDETREQFRQLREKQRPEVRALQEAQTEKINAILSPEQREEYARMRKEREEKRKREEKERGR